MEWLKSLVKLPWDFCDPGCHSVMDGFYLLIMGPGLVISTLVLFVVLSCYAPRNHPVVSYPIICSLAVISLWIMLVLSISPCLKVLLRFWCRHCR